MALTEEQKKHRRVRRQWVAALRSKKYKQGKGYLRTYQEKGPDKFCCLGVLCELAVRAKVIDPANLDEEWSSVYRYENESGVLPEAVIDWVGLASPEGNFDGNGDSLAEVNDKGKKFSTIAKLIESNPEGLFVD